MLNFFCEIGYSFVKQKIPGAGVRNLCCRIGAYDGH